MGKADQSGHPHLEEALASAALGANPNAIRIWDRAAKRETTELVYGEALVRALYGNAIGRVFGDGVLASAWFSKAYGAYQSSSRSRAKIPGFIRDFKIPMEEYVEPEGGFASFNDFFIRKFRPGARAFDPNPKRMPAFAEARYFAWERIQPEQTFPVKGKYLSASALIGESQARPFVGGPLLLARLCPVDYHRFHFPDQGRLLNHYRVAGKLHSVNPLALAARGDILSTNERQVSILDTANFGKLAYIEVGAMCVGTIKQSRPVDQPFERGDEKGYFLFGGSTVIVLGEPGRWKPDADLLEQTTQRRETLARLGEAIAGV